MKEDKRQRATRKRIEEEERRRAVARFLADVGPAPPAADQRVTRISTNSATLIVHTEGDLLPEIYHPWEVRPVE